MRKRVQITLSEEAWSAVVSLIKEANNNFNAGKINYSDAIEEMILSAKVDVKMLRLKHTDFKRSLRAMASQKSVDIDSAIKDLMKLKSAATKQTKQKSNSQYGDA